jgi:hypothetical protein
VALCASLAMAGDYHSGATLVCADCHTMHYSVTHEYDSANAPSGGDALAAGGPFEYLLKNTPNELCMQCHDGQTFAPDVVETNTNVYVRQAGAINKVGGGAPYEEWKGHTLGSTALPPGNNGAYTPSAHGLECVNCHMQHGGSTYRNLTTRGALGSAATITYVTGTNDTTKDVFQRAATLGDLATHYSVGNVDFNEPATTASKYATWCKNCHTDFHGAKGGTELGGDPVSNHDWLRHPTNDVNVGAQSSHGHSKISTAFNQTGKTNWVKTMDPAGLWDYASTTDAAPGDYTPSCFSCHKAHGNQNAFGLIQMDHTGTITEEGTAGGTPKMLCRQCHSQGR